MGLKINCIQSQLAYLKQVDAAYNLAFQNFFSVGVVKNSRCYRIMYVCEHFVVAFHISVFSAGCLHRILALIYAMFFVRLLT